MAEKLIKTRIKLLYKSYSDWQAIKDSFIPLAGEVCIVNAPAASGAVVQEPALLFKVGDGTKTWAQLPFSSALAADVYNWAKKANLDWNDLDATFKASLQAFIEEHAPQQDTQYRIVADGANKWKLQKSADGSTWVDAEGTIDVTALEARIAANEVNIAKKVDKEVSGTNGKALIFNESDGGGSKFEHKDGSEAFVGVNDGGKDGLMAQIYADISEGGVWKGSRINVYHNGIYYVSKANQSAGFEKNAAEMEIAVKKDIQDLGKVLHFVGIAEKQEGETELQAVERTFPAAQQTAGAVAICGAKEFICTGDPLAWKEFGDVSMYATKAELATEASTREAADTELAANIAKKVDKEITSTDGKAIIFNEADGGGAKFENSDNTWSYVGVNNGGKDGIAAQIYAVDSTTPGYQGSKIDVTLDGIYYNKGPRSGYEPSHRDQEEYELAVKGDVAQAKYDVEQELEAEKTRAQAAEQALDARVTVLESAKEPEIVVDGDKTYFYANGISVRIEDATTQNIAYYCTAEGVQKTINFPYGSIVHGGGIGAANKVADYNSTLIIMNGGKVKGIYGGSRSFGNVGVATIVVNGGTLSEGVIGGGAAPNAEEKNSVGLANITLNGGTSVIDFGGGMGLSTVGKVNILVNGGTHQWVTAGGANGTTGSADVKVTGGNITVLQAVNRGVIQDATITVTGGSITRLYGGGETEDTTVTGKCEKTIFHIESAFSGHVYPGTYGGTVSADRLSGDYVLGTISAEEAYACNLVVRSYPGLKQIAYTAKTDDLIPGDDVWILDCNYTEE